MIDGVVGVIIWTDNLSAMLSFYRDKLGLRPHSVREHFVSFKWGDMRLGIGTHSHVQGKTSEPFRTMVNLGVGDIDSEYVALREKGVEFIRPPEKEHWGGLVATFRDPDENTLQLMQLADD